MKRDLLIVGVLVVCAALGIGIVVVLQALQPEDERGTTIKPKSEAIGQLARKEEKKPQTRPVTLPTRDVEKETPSTAAPQEKKEVKPPEPKIDPKVEVKVEPKKEVKVEPKVDVKLEPKKDDTKRNAAKVIVFGNDIKLNDPDGDFALKTINGGERVVVQGKIKTLSIAGLNDKSSLDATLLEAGEIIFTGNLNSGATVLLGKAHTLRLRDINNHSTLDASTLDARVIVLAGAVNSASVVKLHAPGGSVEVLGEINDLAKIEIAAPGGKVVLKGRGESVINGDARVAITAKDVEVRGAVNGAKTQLDITLTKAGSLQFNRLNGTVRLHYRKAEANDPDVRIDAGVIGDRTDFRLMAPAKKGSS